MPAVLDALAARRRLILVLAALLAAAFAVRLGVRLAFGEDYFWKSSYLLYYRLGTQLADGFGFCNGTRCPRPPIYVSLMALAALGGKNFLLIVIPQALLGAATALCAFLIGREMFNTTTGVLACAIAAFYPYYVMHDTALQETVMVALAAALSVWLLLRARRLKRSRDWVLAGLAVGSMVLVRVSLAPTVLAVLLWTAVWGPGGPLGARLRTTAIIAGTVAAMLAPWLLYTWRATGVPVLSTDSGYVLWVGNNADTFSRYPADSIDRSAQVAAANLPAADRAELGRLSGDGIAASNWYRQRALEFIRTHPGAVMHGAWRKLEAAFSWRLNPHRETLAQLAYAASYVPVALLGLLGMALSWRQPGTALIALYYLSFMALSAVFWAHTSHRSYLDVFWIVFAAAAITTVTGKFLRPAP